MLTALISNMHNTQYSHIWFSSAYIDILKKAVPHYFQTLSKYRITEKTSSLNRNVKYAFGFVKGILRFSIWFENKSGIYHILKVTLLITSANYLGAEWTLGGEEAEWAPLWTDLRTSQALSYPVGLPLTSPLPESGLWPSSLHGAELNSLFRPFCYTVLSQKWSSSRNTERKVFLMEEPNLISLPILATSSFSVSMIFIIREIVWFLNLYWLILARITAQA